MSRSLTGAGPGRPPSPTSKSFWENTLTALERRVDGSGHWAGVDRLRKVCVDARVVDGVLHVTLLRTREGLDRDDRVTQDLLAACSREASVALKSVAVTSWLVHWV